MNANCSNFSRICAQCRMNNGRGLIRTWGPLPNAPKTKIETRRIGYGGNTICWRFSNMFKHAHIIIFMSVTRIINYNVSARLSLRQKCQY